MTSCEKIRAHWDESQPKILVFSASSLNFLSNMKLLNWLLSHQKSSENREFLDDFIWSRSLLICLNSLNIKSQTWRQSLVTHILKPNLRFHFCSCTNYQQVKIYWLAFWAENGSVLVSKIPSMLWVSS